LALAFSPARRGDGFAGGRSLAEPPSGMPFCSCFAALPRLLPPWRPPSVPSARDAEWRPRQRLPLAALWTATQP